MSVKKTKIDTQVERQILTGMVVSDEFLKEIIPIYQPDLFENRFSHIIADWCKEYFDKYNAAPKEIIQDIFNKWEGEAKPEQVKYIAGFLANLSDEYEHADKFNVKYVMDKAVHYFKKQSLKYLAEDIGHHLSKDDIVSAEETLVSFKKVERLICPGIDPYQNIEAIRKSFSENYEPLFQVPGELGRMMTPQFTRSSYIILLGPEKRGKTWWLMFLGQQAHKARCNVAEFQVGDMSEAQRVRRQQISLARKSDKPKYCGPMLVPVLDCEHNQKDVCTDRNRTCGFGVYEDGDILAFEEAGDYKPCTYCSGKNKRFKGAIWHTKRPEVEPLNWREAYRTSQDYLKRVRPKGYRLSTHSSRSINVAGIRSQLELWERTDGFIPDVIIVDYKDILAPEHGSSSEERHRKNETDMALRKLSQDYDCCVISASQADAASYYQKSITKANFSEDKRVFGHVTAMFALNQTLEEKRMGLMRLAPLVIREDEYDESFNVTVGQCLAIGAPYLFSFVGENT